MLVACPMTVHSPAFRMREVQRIDFALLANSVLLDGILGCGILKDIPAEPQALVFANAQCIAFEHMLVFPQACTKCLVQVCLPSSIS